MTNVARRAFAVAGLLLLAACAPGNDETEHVLPRPVLSIVVKPPADREVGFAGTVQPQYQTDRGFRVLGRIIARYVYVGDVVKAGQQLARIDSLPYELSVRSSEADLAKAKSQLENATSAESRSGQLLGKDVVSQAEYDAKQQSQAAAAAAVKQAEANLDKAREQLGYTLLTADIDGVVTSTDADVGQIASPGKKVMSLARLDIREAVVDLPDDVTRSLSIGSPFEISLQADRSLTTTGKVREIAPQADAATRTRRVKITLDKINDAFRLGATITATPATTVAQPPLEIPRSALLERGGTTRIWLVDPASKTVKTIAVEVDPGQGPAVQIRSGLKPGERVVVAGVHSLSEGQPVRIDERTSP